MDESTLKETEKPSQKPNGVKWGQFRLDEKSSKQIQAVEK